MRKALVIGIDYYQHLSQLHGCVRDAAAVSKLLSRHSNGDLNFEMEMLTGSSRTDDISKFQVLDRIRALFSGDHYVSLLYFAGHGHIDERTGGYLLASDSRSGEDGISLGDIIALANTSIIRDKIIILDSCYSGIAGARPGDPQTTELRAGTTVLTASTADQRAMEEHGRGSFTELLLNALDGAASNLVGDITPGSVYAHIDQSFGAWGQRPVFKTYVKNFVSLRKVDPPISLADIRRLPEFFEDPESVFRLDPSYEPERSIHELNLPAPDPKNLQIFRLLQKYSRVNLVVPVDAPHMYHAAMNSKGCQLTKLGKFYRRLVATNRI